MRERTHESEEMYLKTIERLTRRKDTVQPVEISEELGYVKSCVSRAVKLLRGKGLITVNETNGISLTASGRRRAEQVRHKYEVLKSFFETIGADADVAENAACKIEHCISEEMCGLIALHTPQVQEHKEKTLPNTNESVEMYLETILRLEERGQATDLTNVARDEGIKTCHYQSAPEIVRSRLCTARHAQHLPNLTRPRDSGECVRETQAAYAVVAEPGRIVGNCGGRCVPDRAYRLGRNTRSGKEVSCRE